MKIVALILIRVILSVCAREDVGAVVFSRGTSIAYSTILYTKASQELAASWRFKIQELISTIARRLYTQQLHKNLMLING